MKEYDRYKLSQSLSLLDNMQEDQSTTNTVGDIDLSLLINLLHTRMHGLWDLVIPLAVHWGLVGTITLFPTLPAEQLADSVWIGCLFPA